MDNKPKILLVDDDLIVLTNLAAYLEDEGYSVFKALNAEDALGLIEKLSDSDSGVNEHMIAIVDIRLPGINGNELIKKCLQITTDTKFIIHTGSTNYEMPPEFESSPAISNNIFRKPIYNMHDYVMEIERLIKE